MKSLNELIEEYTQYLQQGEMQIAYKGILEFLGKLRAEFIKKHPDYDVSSVYQGYMDMSYFSLSTKSLKDKGLKIAIVYLHEKGGFEVWLSARNRDIAKNYVSLLNSNISGDIKVFHVGTALFNWVLQYARQQGCYDVTLNVWEGNDDARVFYEKMGMFIKETQMEVILK